MMLPPPWIPVQLMPDCRAIVTVKTVQFVGEVSFHAKPKGVLRPKRPAESSFVPFWMQVVSVWFTSCFAGTRMACSGHAATQIGGIQLKMLKMHAVFPFLHCVESRLCPFLEARLLQEAMQEESLPPAASILRYTSPCICKKRKISREIPVLPTAGASAGCVVVDATAGEARGERATGPSTPS